MGGLAIHARLSPGLNPIWLADEEDKEVIGGALARIAARHSPGLPGGGGDIFDGITAAVGVVGYAIKNYERQAGAHQPEGPEFDPNVGRVPGPGAPPVS